MFNDDDRLEPSLTIEATVQALGGEVASTRITTCGYFRPIFLAVLIVTGMGFAIYLSYILRDLNSTIDQEFARQLFKLGLIGGPLLLAIVYWYWRSLRRSIYLCEYGLIEATPRQVRSVSWEQVTQLQEVRTQRQWLKGPLGPLFAIQEKAYLIHFESTAAQQPDAIVIERWAFADSLKFFQQVINAAVEQGIPVILEKSLASSGEHSANQENS